MIQLILHLVGDYVTQSNWMATRKTERWWPAFCHAFIYSLPFLWIGSHRAVFVIGLSHFLIDRYRLARYLVWLKNFLCPWAFCEIDEPEGFADWTYKAPEGFYPLPGRYPLLATKNPPFRGCSKTGYPNSIPAWLAVWLMIVADNTLHLVINYLALVYL
jgi:hypothetical protein